MGADSQVHRSGTLKQSNKLHKTGRHRSKGTIDKELKGKIEVNKKFGVISSSISFTLNYLGKVSVKAISRRQKNAMTKDQRRHQANQVRAFFT